MKTEASFSVEAAFVMPFVFWIIVFVIQTGLFMCDCCIAEAFLYERLTGKETFRKEFFVSECRVSDVQNEYPEKQVEAILKIKSPLFKFVDERKISICLVEDTPVKNAHSARAVRKIIKNLYTIVGE